MWKNEPANGGRLLELYRDGLLADTLPFWIRHCVDWDHGGFMMSLDRDGTVIDSDKGLWQNCRFTWLLASLYCEVERCEEWRSLAEHGIRFILDHGFDRDGRMFFSVTREGAPLRKRRYLFTEAFGCMALAACARALREQALVRRAEDLFQTILYHYEGPGLLEPKVNPQTRPLKGLGMPMILIALCREMRQVSGEAIYDHRIEQCVREIRTDFMQPELRAVLENVGSQGETFLQHADGRLLVPGHGIEAAWFILREAANRGLDPDFLQTGLAMLDWMWTWGWDDECGGILYFRDVKGYPVQEYWHDMKFWWPQNEAIIATLLAYGLTGDEKYATWHKMAHDWAYRHFPDPVHGEWFGYLHRDGSRASRAKGNLWKGPFHLPRMQRCCWEILDRMPR